MFFSPPDRHLWEHSNNETETTAITGSLIWKGTGEFLSNLIRLAYLLFL